MKKLQEQKEIFEQAIKDAKPGSLIFNVAKNEFLLEVLKKQQAFNQVMLNHFLALNPDWKTTKYGVAFLKQSLIIDDAIKTIKH